MGGPSFIARNVGKYGTQGKAGDLRLPGNTGRKNARVNVRPDSITFKESVKAPLALLNHVNSVPGKRKTQNKVCIDEMASMMDCLNKMNNDTRLDGLCGKEIKGFQECYKNAKSEDIVKRRTRGKIPLGQNLQDFNQDQLTAVLKRQCQNKNVVKGQRIYNHPEFQQKIPGQK